MNSGYANIMQMHEAIMSHGTATQSQVSIPRPVFSSRQIANTNNGDYTNTLNLTWNGVTISRPFHVMHIMAFTTLVNEMLDEMMRQLAQQQ